MVAEEWVPFYIEPALASSLTQMREEAEQAVKDTMPVRSGATRDSVEAEIVGADEIDVTASAVAGYLTRGTAGHGPRTAPYMHWRDERGETFTKYVAGIGPNDYLDRATESLAERWMDRLMEAISPLWEGG